MARVKCVMMQRDETLLLEAWFRYYGYLFGFENLVVFDNGSKIPKVVATLKKYQQAGSRIFWEHTRVDDYFVKHLHAENVIRHWDAVGGYDFAMALDCDEFFAVFTEHGLDFSRTAIHAHLDELTGEEQALAFTHSLFNSPKMPGTFWAQYYPKSFLAADTVQFIDHGSHAAESRKKEGKRYTNFTYLHMHNKPFEMLKLHARRKLEPFVDLRDLEAVKNFKGPGLHLTPYLSMTEDDYHAQHDDKLLVSVPGFLHHMRALGVETGFFGTNAEITDLERRDQVGLLFPAASGGGHQPVVDFDGEAYLRHHVDVAAARVPALSHFLSAGYAERRLLPRSDAA